MPILKMLSKQTPTVGYDINPQLMDEKKFVKYEKLPTLFLHVCIPFTSKFVSNVVSLYKKFKPQCIIIHSTISPGTTNKIQSMFKIPIIYSATRGVHKRMLY